MQNMQDLTLLEKEFEDLQGLIQQHFCYLQDLDSLKKRIDHLHQLEQVKQEDTQKTADLLDRIETTHHNLGKRTGKLEIRLQDLSDQISQLHQTLNQNSGEISTLSRQQNDLEASVFGLEPRLLEFIREEVDRTNKESLRHIQNLEIHFNELYSKVRQSSQRMEASLTSVVLVGLIGFAGLLLTYLYLFSNE